MKRNCIVGQSGGPTVAINATLAGIISKCSNEKFDHIYGMINGIKGLLEGSYMDLRSNINNMEMLEKLRTSPAMYLGSCRYKLPDMDVDDTPYKELFEIFDELKITDFMYIGGNDSMDTVAKLSRYALKIGSDIRFIGLPKTIDNDLMGTDHTPGFGSAAKYVASSMLEIAYDSSIYKLDSVTIVEIMGRNAGWLTAASALARSSSNKSPDLIYLPEVPFSKEQFIYDIGSVLDKKSCVLVAVSEGVKENGEFLDNDSEYASRDVFGHILHSGTGKVLEHLVSERFGCKVRSIELNVLQRCAMHIASKTDLDEAFMVGEYTVEQAIRGETGKMVILNRVSSYPYKSECALMDVNDAANLEHKIPVDWINDEHNDVNPQLVEYLFPLIQGEVPVEFKSGIPSYIDINHLKYSF